MRELELMFTLDPLRWRMVPLNFDRVAYNRMISVATLLDDQKMAFRRPNQIRSEHYRTKRSNSSQPDCTLMDI